MPGSHAAIRATRPSRGASARPRRPAATRGRYAAVSLFSGAGGLDLGAESTSRVRVVWANDNERWACETYRRNLGAHIAEGDIHALDVPQVPCDILLAGPPCQDFSQLWNHDGARTARGNLFREVARFLAEMKPAGFVLENVPGLLSANRGVAWTIVRHALRAPASFLYRQPGVRYDLSAQVVDMADLGVPQHRERLLVLGVRRDLGIRPPLIPQPAADAHVSARDALEFPPIPDDAPNHERGLDSPDVVERLKLIPPGRNYTVIPQDHPLFVKGLISHVYRRLDPDTPSYTVIANGGGGTHGYHYREPRRLSNRERARLQTFPDSFVFADGGPGRSAYPRVRRQVGNAVPPRAAEIVASALVHRLQLAGVPLRSSRELAEARRTVLKLGGSRPATAEAREAA
jgi:DNA (cytosine-5)-methyltransferase 1